MSRSRVQSLSPLHIVMIELLDKLSLYQLLISFNILVSLGKFAIIIKVAILPNFVKCFFLHIYPIKMT